MPSDVRFTAVRKTLEEQGYRLNTIPESHHKLEQSGGQWMAIAVHNGKTKHAYDRKYETVI